MKYIFIIKKNGELTKEQAEILKRATESQNKIIRKEKDPRKEVDNILTALLKEFS